MKDISKNVRVITSDANEFVVIRTTDDAIVDILRPLAEIEFNLDENPDAIEYDIVTVQLYFLPDNPKNQPTALHELLRRKANNSLLVEGTTLGQKFCSFAADRQQWHIKMRHMDTVKEIIKANWAQLKKSCC